MKSFSKLIILMILTVFTTQRVEAQFLKRLAKKAQEKIEREANRRAERRVNKGIDKVYDEVEDEIDGKNKKTKDKDKEKKEDSSVKKEAEDNHEAEEQNEAKEDNDSTEASEKSDKTKQKPTKPKVVWSKFDFIPGDTVLFEDGPDADEENGEFPSRWDLVKGQIEIAEVDGEPVLMFIDGNPQIVPYLKNAKEDYLPEVFTIEFDYYKPKKGNRITVYLYDTKNQRTSSNRGMFMDISTTGVQEKLEGVKGDLPDINYSNRSDARWIHVSIAYTKGKLKVYMDDTRVINIPHYSGNPSGLALQAYWADLGDNKAYYFKNVRIAKGGVKYYDRVLSEGKIIVNGIKFDVNKATLRPESMGPINKIYKMMKKNKDLNFSIEGHTDSDGSEEANLALSKQRGKAVMEKLISMGIDADRLKYGGYGENKPIDNNSTPEGKANNRRVEFVKF